MRKLIDWLWDHVLEIFLTSPVWICIIIAILLMLER